MAHRLFLLPLIACIGLAIQATCQAQEDEDVEFRELVLSEPATSMAMTEDGLHMIFTHQSANFVTVYDILGKRVVTTIPLLSPRSVICRGDEVYVANFGESTVSILSKKNGWKKINDLKLPGPIVVHLSAPRGEAFRRQMIAVCRGDGGNHENKIYLVDIDRDQARELGKSELAEFSADGRTLLFQAVLRNDGFGGLAAYSAGQVNNLKGLGDPSYRGGTGQTPYVFQVASSGFWFSQGNIFGGTPINSLHYEPSSLIVPDWSGKRFYALSDSLIKCVALDTGFRELDSRRAIYPVAMRDFNRVWQHMDRQAALLCDQPSAYVHKDRLHLFVITAKGAAVLSADTPAMNDGTSR